MTAQASKQSGEDLFKRRLTWFERQPDLEPARLVFIDESGVSTRMARVRGRSLKGERCRAPVPHRHWKTITLMPGVGLNGVAAPALVDGGNERRDLPDLGAAHAGQGSSASRPFRLSRAACQCDKYSHTK
jgi:hypothetical protein